jgi:hypothetical protein
MASAVFKAVLRGVLPVIIDAIIPQPTTPILPPNLPSPICSNNHNTTINIDIDGGTAAAVILTLATVVCIRYMGRSSIYIVVLSKEEARQIIGIHKEQKCKGIINVSEIITLTHFDSSKGVQDLYLVILTLEGEQEKTHEPIASDQKKLIFDELTERKTSITYASKQSNHLILCCESDNEVSVVQEVIEKHTKAKVDVVQMFSDVKEFINSLSSEHSETSSSRNTTQSNTLMTRPTVLQASPVVTPKVVPQQQLSVQPIVIRQAVQSVTTSKQVQSVFTLPKQQRNVHLTQEQQTRLKKMQSFLEKGIITQQENEKARIESSGSVSPSSITKPCTQAVRPITTHRQVVQPVTTSKQVTQLTVNTSSNPQPRVILAQDSKYGGDCKTGAICPTKNMETECNYVLPSKLRQEDVVPCTKDELNIYYNQYNIGRLIVEKWYRNVLTIEDLYSAKSINLIIMGPTYTDLRDQTRSDIEKFLYNEKLAIKKPIVVNSNALKTHQDKFFNRLQNNENELHVVVHDEAHWGIKQDSQINKFFQELAKIRDSLHANNQSRKLLILLVSATIDVVTKSVEDLEESKRHVKWAELIRDEPEYYSSTTYKSIQNLELIIDRSVGTSANLEDASAKVVQEYQDAADAIIHRQKANSIAAQVLNDLCQSQGPMMAVVRLALNQHATNLVRHLRRSINIPDVFVVEFVQGSNIQQQLVDQGYKGKEIEALDELQHIKVLLIIVDKVRMGVRIPGTCRYFDVRCCYLEKGISSFATFIQDVGRCAGHNKLYSAKILASVDFNVKSNVKNLDQLIRGVERPRLVNTHPEYSKRGGVYTALKEHIVVLDAQPQIGKTGSILSALWILNKRFIEKPKKPFKRFSTILTSMTLTWSRIATRDLEEFRQQFVGEQWQLYHDTYRSAQQGWNVQPNQWICEQLASLFDNQIDDEEKLIFADNGCGPDGITKEMRSTNNGGRWNNVTVHGYDIDPRIEALSSNKEAPVFIPHIELMCQTTPPDMLNAAIFCLSFFDEDCSYCQEWCRCNVKNNGYVLILELTRRLSDTFVQSWKNVGFTLKYNKQCDLFTLLIFKKNKGDGKVKAY